MKVPPAHDSLTMAKGLSIGRRSASMQSSFRMTAGPVCRPHHHPYSIPTPPENKAKDMVNLIWELAAFAGDRNGQTSGLLTPPVLVRIQICS